MATPLTVRGIYSFKHETNEYMVVSLCFLGRTPNGELVYGCIHRKLHLVDSLAANILIGTDIIGLEGIIINLEKRQPTFQVVPSN